MELTDEYFVFTEGMKIGFMVNGKPIRRVVKDVLYVAASPNVDNTLGTLEAKILYEKE